MCSPPTRKRVAWREKKPSGWGYRPRRRIEEDKRDLADCGGRKRDPMNFVLGTVLVLGLLILVHEWGHFVVARLFGVRVDVFSIGFGPRLFGWKRGATDYRVSALPLGGYVRMAGQDLSEADAGTQAPTGAPDELMSKPRWQRALITLAGPSVNLLFPIVLLTGFYMLKGDPYLSFSDLPVQVQGVPSSAATGTDALRAGDKLLNLNGVQNPTWEQAFKLVE